MPGPRHLLVDERRLPELTDDLAGHDVDVHVVTRELLYAIATVPLHQGVLGCGDRLPRPSAEEVVAGARRVLVLDAMNDHENMGPSSGRPVPSAWTRCCWARGRPPSSSSMSR